MVEHETTFTMSIDSYMQLIFDIRGIGVGTKPFEESFEERSLGVEH